MNLTERPEYKASAAALDEAIRKHHEVLEALGNETFDDSADTSIVSGWVLVIGTTGFNSEDGEFHDQMVEAPSTTSWATASGYIRYAQRFVDYQMDNFTGPEVS